MLIHTDKDINYNSEAEWKPKRNRKEIACCSWTTASGQVTPILFKMQDEDGIIRTFDKIHVNHSEKKLYAGIPSYEFDCDIFVTNESTTANMKHYDEMKRLNMCGFLTFCFKGSDENAAENRIHTILWQNTNG